MWVIIAKSTEFRGLVPKRTKVCVNLNLNQPPLIRSNVRTKEGRGSQRRKGDIFASFNDTFIHVTDVWKRNTCLDYWRYKCQDTIFLTKILKSRLHHFHKLKQHKVSASKMKRFINIVRRGTIAILDEEAEIKSADEAIIVATKIFQNVAKPSSMYIHLEDLVCFIREDEAAKMMRLFEGEKVYNRISKLTLQKWVVNAFIERRALALTLDNTETAVNNVHHILKIMVVWTNINVWLLIFGVGKVSLVVINSRQLLVFVFTVGNPCKTTLESVLFLFGRHPFDVGDYCEIKGVQLLVEEMNIMSTVFLRPSDGCKISYPNDFLASVPICNYSRSLAFQHEVQGVGAEENGDLRASQETSSDSQPCQDEGRKVRELKEENVTLLGPTVRDGEHVESSPYAAMVAA